MSRRSIARIVPSVTSSSWFLPVRLSVTLSESRLPAPSTPSTACFWVSVLMALLCGLGSSLSYPHCATSGTPARRLSALAAPAAPAGARIGAVFAGGALGVVRGQLGRLLGVDRQRDRTLGDPPDLGGVHEAGAVGRAHDDAVEDLLARVVEHLVDRPELDPVGAEHGRAAREEIVGVRGGVVLEGHRAGPPAGRD